MSRKHAVVTGGTGGLGGGVVAALLADGWRVHVPFRTRSEADALKETPGAAEGLRLAEADLTDPASVEAFFRDVAAEGGPLRLLCNLVGGFAMGSLEETEPGTWDRMLALNATAPFLAIRAATPLLREAGGGSVVNVAAAKAFHGPTGGMTAYLAAKTALASLTRNLAAELASDAITVNSVAPTTIDTEANRQAMPDADRSTWIAPREIADVIRFLAGDQARVVTGSVLELRKG